MPQVEQSAGLIQQIAAASREQESGAEQISQAIHALDKVIQQNAAAAEEMATTAEELSGQAELLEQSIAFFQTRSDLAPGGMRRALPTATDVSEIQLTA